MQHLISDELDLAPEIAKPTPDQSVIADIVPQDVRDPVGAPPVQAMTEEGIDIPVHSVAALFPLMEETEFQKLVDNMKTHGQLLPCVTHEGVLIDGRNRWRACRQLGFEPKIAVYNGRPDYVCDYVLSLNIERRSLSPDQVVVITAQAYPFLEQEAKLRQERTQFQPGVSPNPGGKPKPEVNLMSGSPERDIQKMHANSTVGRIAAKAKTSRHKAAQAIKLTKTSPSLGHAVAAGKVKLIDAVKKPNPVEPRVWSQEIGFAAIDKVVARHLGHCPAASLALFKAEIVSRVNKQCQ
jgi:hypothetical protein